MTTDIRVRVNGNYVAEGHMSVRRNNPPLGEAAQQENTPILVSGVGSKEAVEQSFHVPHDSHVVIDVQERPATQDELDAAAQKAAEGDTQQD